jgi:hypothetical protein
MVGIAIQCRLGNQLFQYAFIKSVSEKFNTSFFIRDTADEFIAAKYFDLKGYNPILNTLNWLLFKIKTKNVTKTLQAISIDDYGGAKDNEVYNGYFQSEGYFTNISAKIPSYIKVKAAYKNQFGAKYGAVFTGPVVAVHIRRGDYLSLNQWWKDNWGSDNLTLPTNYYLDCLGMIGNLERYKIIFLSDDIDFARSEFAHVKNAGFAQNDMITDFQVLMNADICILSNSSFSWWGAYLNQKQEKKIYCPRYWLGFKVKEEYPTHIIPAGWEQVSVNG